MNVPESPPFVSPVVRESGRDSLRLNSSSSGKVGLTLPADWTWLEGDVSRTSPRVWSVGPLGPGSGHSTPSTPLDRFPRVFLRPLGSTRTPNGGETGELCWGVVVSTRTWVGT